MPQFDSPAAADRNIVQHDDAKRQEPAMPEFQPAAPVDPPRVETGADGSPARLMSLDAYRGFVMLLMVSSGFALAYVAKTYPVELGLVTPSGAEQHGFWAGLWKFLSYQFSHVEWAGCSLWDLIQPSFMFIVGAAMPFSEARRDALAQSKGKRLAHAAGRSLILILLGVFLMSNSTRNTHTHWSFVNVLSQIGLGYFFVYLLVRRHWMLQLLAATAILVGYWFVFYRYEPPPNEKAEVERHVIEAVLPTKPPDERKPDWNQFPPSAEFASHYNKHVNAAAAFDRWFLNLVFPWQDRTPTAEVDRELGQVEAELNRLQSKLRAEALRQAAIAARLDEVRQAREHIPKDEPKQAHPQNPPSSDGNGIAQPELTAIKREGETSVAPRDDENAEQETSNIERPTSIVERSRSSAVKTPSDPALEVPPAAFVIRVPELQRQAEQTKARFQQTQDRLAAPLDKQSRETKFVVNEGGYQSLNFVPSMATMIFGLMAGGLLMNRRRSPGGKTRRLFVSGLVCFAVAMAVDTTIWPVQIEGLDWTLSPTVKRIWTPTWAVFSAGWTLWLLAAFYWVIDVKGIKGWAFPFVVVGMNSIAVYLMAQLIKPWISGTLETHLSAVYLYSAEGLWFDLIENNIYGRIYETLLQLFIIWLIALWMYRKRIFVRI